MYEPEDIESIMEEPPGGENHGTVTTSYVDDDGGMRVAKTPLSQRTHDYSGGWGVVSRKTGRTAGGMVAHRGVTADDEYVDADRLKALVEKALGFTYEQIRSVYRSGPLSADQRQLRDKIDARLLALSRSGGNMLALAKVLGWAVEPSSNGGGESSRTMERAIARAKAAA